MTDLCNILHGWTNTFATIGIIIVILALLSWITSNIHNRKRAIRDAFVYGTKERKIRKVQT